MGKRICLLTQHPYPQHVTVFRSVRHLLQRGHDVTVICCPEGEQPAYERHGKLRVHRLPVPHRRAGVLRYLYEYAAFGALSGLLLSWLQLVRRFHTVAIDNLPDTLVFSALVPKLVGARIVFSMYELTPEMYAAAYGLKPDHPLMRLLYAVERAAVRFSDHVITVSATLQRRLRRAGVDEANSTVVLNVRADEDVAPVAPSNGVARPFTLITHGTIVERYGIQTAIAALPRILRAIPDARLVIAGAGEYRATLERQAQALGVARHVEWAGFLPWPAVRRRLAEADVALVPIVGHVYGHLMLPNKLFEYVLCELPVVATELDAIREYFDESCIAYVPSEDPAALAERVIALARDPQARRRLVDNASARLADYRWPKLSRQFEAALMPPAPGRGWASYGREAARQAAGDVAARVGLGAREAAE